MFPIDLSAFNGPICKQSCFQTLKDGVCVCVVKDGKGRKLAVYSFQKAKCWKTRSLLQLFLSSPSFVSPISNSGYKSLFFIYLGVSK